MPSDRPLHLYVNLRVTRESTCYGHVFVMTTLSSESGSHVMEPGKRAKARRSTSVMLSLVGRSRHPSTAVVAQYAASCGWAEKTPESESVRRQPSASQPQRSLLCVIATCRDQSSWNPCARRQHSHAARTLKRAIIEETQYRFIQVVIDLLS